MKPDYHERISRIAAQRILRDALSRRGAPEVDLGPLYLGNWVADYSQFLLPLYEKRLQVREWLLVNIGAFLDSIVTAIEGLKAAQADSRANRIPEAHDLLELLAQVRAETAAASEALLARLPAAVRDLPAIRVLAVPPGTFADVEDAARSVRATLQQLDERVRGRVRPLILQLKELAFFRYLLTVFDDPKAMTDEWKRQLTCVIDEHLPEDGQRRNVLDRLVRATIVVKGYFQFVHPEPGQQQRRMQADVFFAIMRSHLGFSYCHEHSDRRRTLGRTKEDEYDPPPSGAPVNGVYPYLEEDARLIAGRFYELERDWAIPCFDEQSVPIRDDEPRWYCGLAKLGHALHGVEDFFAHTSFVEHARLALWARGEKQDLTPDDRSLRAQRVMRMPIACNPIEEHEPWVASGYFDGWDTAVAIFDKILDGFGFEAVDPEADLLAVKAGLRDVGGGSFENVRQTLQELARIRENPADAFDDPTNDLAQRLGGLREYAKLFQSAAPLSPEALKEISRQATPELGGELVPWLADYAHALGEVLRRSKLVWRTLMYASEVVGLVRDVQAGRRARLRRSGIALRILSERTIGAVVAYAAGAVKTRYVKSIKDSLGARRLGSHSLLAKDEPDSLYFIDGMKLAVAAESFIVSAITRATARESAPVPLVPRYHDLLGFFLRHPLRTPISSERTAVDTATGTLMIRVMTDAETPEQIAGRFTPTADREAVQRDRYESFDWRVIVDWNFGLFGSTTPTAVRLARNGTVIFPRGSLVLVPYQRCSIPVSIVDDVTDEWWTKVLAISEMPDITAAFAEWERDPTKRPLDIAFDLPSHAATDRRALDELLETEINVAAGLRTSRIREELRARRLPDRPDMLVDRLKACGAARAQTGLTPGTEFRVVPNPCGERPAPSTRGPARAAAETNLA